MKTVILGDLPPALSSLIAQRQRFGLDTHDEIWNGEYHMAPAAAFRHGESQGRLFEVLAPRARARGLRLGLEFNLGHKDDFRVPDLGLFRGEPDGVWFDTVAMVVEVRSPDDESLEKFGFYFGRGVEEILIADLVTETIQWFVRGSSRFEAADASSLLGVSGSELANELGW